MLSTLISNEESNNYSHLNKKKSTKDISLKILSLYLLITFSLIVVVSFICLNKSPSPTNTIKPQKIRLTLMEKPTVMKLGTSRVI